MPAIASFHLVRYAGVDAPRAMAAMGTDRLRLARTPGLAAWRLLGTGAGDSTAPGADLRRWALFALWDDSAHLQRFESSSAIARRWERADEAYHLHLDRARGHGSWRGVPVADALAGPFGASAGVTATGDGPVAVVTRAVVRARHLRRFAAASRAVAAELPGQPGLLAVVGVGEAPIARQATVSLWRNDTDIDAYAARTPAHADALARTRAEGWYGEELFVRLRVVSHRGTWSGHDPLG